MCSLFSLLGDLASFLTERELERKRKGKKGNDKREKKADIKGNLLSKLTIRAALI